MIIGTLAERLEWEVEERPIFDAHGNALPRFKGLYNDATGDLLHVVGQGYAPTTNAMIMENIEVLTERTGLTIQGFETFRGGAKVMAYLTDTTPRMVGRANYETSNFMVIGNSNDYTSSFFTGFTNRVHRCENMFSAKNQQNRIPHTADSSRRITELMRAHELYYDSANGFFRISEQLERVTIGDHHRESFTKYVLDITDLQDVSARKKNQISSFQKAISTEVAAFGANLLGLFQGATRYVSRELRVKNSTFGNLVGRPAAMNARAFEYVKAIESQNRAQTIAIGGYTAPPLVEIKQTADFLI